MKRHTHPKLTRRAILGELMRLRMKVDQLTSAGDELASEVAAGIPEKNCSCHISPPCTDCVDYAWQRELVANYHAAAKA